MKFRHITFLLIFLTAVAAVSSSALAVVSPQTFYFHPISDFQSFDTINESSLYVEVIESSEAEVRFKFHNDIPDSNMIASSIYFDDKTPFLNYENPQINTNNSSEVIASYASSVSAENVTTANDEFDVSFNYASQNKNKLYSYNQLIEALNFGSVNIKMQVQAIGGSFSGALTSYSIAMTPVPEPASMLLLGTGLVGIAGIARKRKKLYK